VVDSDPKLHHGGQLLVTFDSRLDAQHVSLSHCYSLASQQGSNCPP